MKQIDGALRYSATDLASFLACRHLTRLDQAVAFGLAERPHLREIGADALAQRGQQHEQRVLQGFRDQGCSVVDLTEPRDDIAARVEATLAAVRQDVDVIYQGALQIGDRLGFPDFLVRGAILGGEAEDGHEVVDAKLARSAKALAVLQCAFYSRLLAELSGVEPRNMHLALGNGEFATLRVHDYAAYERQIDSLFRAAIALPAAIPSPDTYPDPAEHCAVCRWRVVCSLRRREDDDLSLIAGITSRQRKALKDVGVATRRHLAGLVELPALDRVGREALERTHAQARLQVAGEDAQAHLWEFVEPEREEDGSLTPNRGLLALPEPAEGDLFFDIEGARYYSVNNAEFGLQYLFGIVDSADLDESGQPRYYAFWAFDRPSERVAFERTVDFIAERLAAHPGAHVYHYNHYEPTSLDHLSELHVTREDVIRRLMGRFATREDEVDDLLRERVFVDLYRVVRQGVRASVESYSIKRLEPLYGFARAVELDDVNERMVTFEFALDEGMAQLDDKAEDRAAIQGYNEDDCRSTQGLRDWLEARRAELARELDEPIPRPVSPEARPDRTDPEVRDLHAALISGIPQDEGVRTPEQRARALMADLLEYYRREDKPKWWRYFHLHDLTDDELLEEPDAMAGLEFVGIEGQIRKSELWGYRFPPQEHGFAAGDSAEDPRSGQSWPIYDLDDETGTLVMVRGPSKLGLPHPTALIELGPQYGRVEQNGSIRALARRVIHLPEIGWPREPELDLLLRRRPDADRGTDGPLQLPDEETRDAGLRLARGLDHSNLPLQGPPGTGKTYTGALQILELIGQGKRVGVTATSHAVICNLLTETSERAREAGIRVRIGQKPGEEEAWICGAARDAELVFRDNATLRGRLAAGDVDVVGGTTWVWARPEFERSVDVLVVDEAGQMSLADVLASARAAGSVILLGDPMQLAHPSQGAHPPGSSVSALEHILGTAKTMPEDLGLFMDRTRRMHPDITRFTSEAFYEGRLSGIPGLENQVVLGAGYLSGSGLRFISVEHQGNANSSPEEAEAVVEVVRGLVQRQWRDREDRVHPIGTDQVLVVTPFNAQIREIREAFERAGERAPRVGTVDKFQGRQAPVVLYSMASSSAEDAPRGLEFLYDLHRLNVATSRALCLAVIVGSPELVRVYAKTPRQMRLVNALCRFRELVPPGTGE